MAWRERLANLGPRLYWEVRDLVARRPAPAPPAAPVYGVLFVCFGNVCRSPLATAVFRRKLDAAGLAAFVTVDGAGTSDANAGKRPYWKARACAARYGLRLSQLRARQIRSTDFERFDRILVMDERNRQDVLHLAPRPQDANRVQLLLDLAGGGEIADPIGGDAADFERVYRQIDAACEALLHDVAREVGRRSTAGASGRP